MINIKIHYKTQYGQALYISGQSTFLGRWNPNQAVRMNWTENDIWVAEIAYHQIEYKYFVSDFDFVSDVLWESGPNRKASSDKFDIWNCRKICFQCHNPQRLDIYLSHSSSKCDFQLRVRMKNHKEYSILKTIVNVQQPLYYQYHIIQKSEFSSSIFSLDYNTEQSYHKDSILVFCTSLTKLKQIVFQLNKNIFYGFVPNAVDDYEILQKQKLNTVVEFCSQTDKNIVEQSIKDNCTHMVINLFHFKKETFVSRLINLLKVLIQKYNTLYICNNSLGHLRKYLHMYEKFEKECFSK